MDKYWTHNLAIWSHCAAYIIEPDVNHQTQFHTIGIRKESFEGYLWGYLMAK